jgi:uncharacterized protein (TIGR01244 family)
MKMKWVFLLAVLVGIGLVVGNAAIDHSRRAQRSVAAKPLAVSVWVTEQINESQLADIKAKGFRTVVDLRPDGEAVDQPPAAEMARAAQASGLGFSYIPVPHGDIPTAAVDALDQALAQSDKPLLLYCRSGRRAARTWALAEASRPGGLDAAAIQAAARAAGQSADDLAAQIGVRIAARPANH